MSEPNSVRRVAKKLGRTGWRLRRLGLWTGLVMLALVAVTVFTLCACKSGPSR